MIYLNNGDKHKGPKRWFYELCDQNENKKLVREPNDRFSF